MTRSRKLPVGTEFGMWTIIGEAEPSARGDSRSHVRCSCGTERIVQNTHLRDDKWGSRSCGCVRYPTVANKRRLRVQAMKGTVYGDRELIGYVGCRRNGKIIVSTQCKCGSVDDVALTALVARRADKCRTCHLDSFGPVSKLTEKEVREIRKLAEAKVYTQKVIGEMFGVSQPTVANIKRGWIWSDVK